MKQEDKAGIYTTVIIHLAVLIVLLATSLGFSLQSENSFVLDFSKLEELERLQEEEESLRKEAEFQQAISDRLEAEIGAAPGGYRNVAVDRAALKDDRVSMYHSRFLRLMPSSSMRDSNLPRSASRSLPPMISPIFGKSTSIARTVFPSGFCFM